MRNQVTLKRYEKEDSELLWKIYNDKKYVEFFRRIPAGWRREDVENFEALTGSQLFLCKLVGLEDIGFAVISKIDWFGLSSDVGLVLLDKYQDETRSQYKLAFWAMLSLAQMLFDRMPLKRMSFKFLKKRQDIEKSLQRGGLRKEGEYKESCIVDGLMEDELEYCLDKYTYDMMYK